MRVFFVGDGAHDVGIPDGPHPDVPWPAERGVVPILVRRILPEVAAESLAYTWQKLTRFGKEEQGRSRRRNYRHLKEKKIEIAALYAEREGCVVVIAVHDRDGREPRGYGLPKFLWNHEHRVLMVEGIAVESIEAWTLGAKAALATVLNVEPKKLRQMYPKAAIESLHQGRNKGLKPKELLQQIAALGKRSADRSFRDQVAEETDLQELARECPEGFGSFLKMLRDPASEGNIYAELVAGAIMRGPCRDS